MQELSKQFCWGEDSHLLGCDAVTGHMPAAMNNSDYHFTSCSLSVIIFRWHFKVKLSPQWQWKGFSLVWSVTCLFKLICWVNAFPHTHTHTEPFCQSVS
jgi:hypothetical protein